MDHPRLRVYTLRGKRTFLAWLRGKQNTWRTELAEGKPPAAVTSAALDLPPGLPALEAAAVCTYDPWTDRWAPAQVAAGKGALPPLKRSLVVRIDFRG